MSKYLSALNSTSTTQNTIFNSSVGIGTNPSNTLEVRNSGFIQGLFSSSGSSGGIKLKNSNNYEWELQSITSTNLFSIIDRNAGGLSRFIINMSGNVGIGTEDPTQNMHLLTSSSGFPGLKLENTNSASAITGIQLEVKSNAKQFNLGVGNSVHSSLNNKFFIYDNTLTTTRFLIGATGNIGIGTEDPLAKLHVKQSNTDSGGDLTTYGESAIIMESSNTTNKWSIAVNGTGPNNLAFHYNLTEKGYLDNAVSVGNIDFTGQHRSHGIQDLTHNHIGLIVISTGEYYNMSLGITNVPTINESLPCIDLAQTHADKRVFGVISDKEDTQINREYSTGSFVSVYPKNDNNERLIINSLGEGGIWVCNKEGIIYNGDYITTCTVVGYGTKQNDDLLHNYTVAKITQDEDFTDMTLGITSGNYYYERARYLDAIGNLLTESEYNILLGITSSAYKAKFVGCTYHCG